MKGVCIKKLQLAELAFSDVSHPGQLIPSSAQRMIDHKQPHGEAAQGDEDGGERTEQRNEPAQHMGDHQHTEGNQRLQRMKEHKTAALLQGKEDDSSNKGEKVAYGRSDIIRQSGG